ncbi:MAG: hypothetical protein HOA00_01240, partial [Rhodospirillaceae bacterium]|nr:hypothetical protein [Rhodospirillaceae bacterium]
MRDTALETAIDAAGGTAALARTINVTPQAISQWDRVPAERVIAVEEATKGKVTRSDLRPDLYPSADGGGAVAQPDGKWVYFFGDGEADGRAEMRDLLGGKGANLAEMSAIGVPVPPGFTVTTGVCTYFYDHGRVYPTDLKDQVNDGLRRIEATIEAKFGDPSNPLLVSVRSGARASMPGMMDT